MSSPLSSRPLPLHGSLVSHGVGLHRSSAQSPVARLSGSESTLLTIVTVLLMGLGLVFLLSLLIPKGEPMVRTDLPVQTKRFVLSSFGQSSFFHVILRDAVTDELSRPLYVVRQCGAEAGDVETALRVGDEYTLTVQPYTLSDSQQTVRYTFGDLSKVFCKRPALQIYF